ncbi:MAG: phosphatidylserine decarboxylase [Elusimicrobia bacterium]|nr:phosphatidylserine decarboxylase [Elusimicrobiota bacterium]
MTAWAITGILAVITSLVAWFFRDPQRRPNPEELSRLKPGEQPIISPAEGKVTDITEIPGANPADRRLRIGVFLSPIDVHVQWVPFEGKVTRITRKNGKFLPAYDPQASHLNASATIEIQNPRLGLCVVRQITGFLVRRILTWTEEGSSLKPGERLGMILLGSRVEIELPKERVNLKIRVGDKVDAGRSVIGGYEH